MINYLLQEAPDVSKSGKKVVYPKFILNHQIDYESFLKSLRNYYPHCSEPLVQSVVSSVVEHMLTYLSMGHSVKIDGLGVFSLSLEFSDDKPTEMKDEKDQMKYRKVRVKNWTLKTDPDTLKKLRQKTECQRAEPGVNRQKKNALSLEERISNALQIIDRNGYMTLTDYVIANNICRSSASVELKKICKMAGSQIQASGRGSHKVWVRRRE